jgi:hypothetical protein
MAMLDRLETLLERGQGLADADLDVARSLVNRLRVFVDRCCGCAPSRTTKAETAEIEEALRRLSELLAQGGAGGLTT